MTTLQNTDTLMLFADGELDAETAAEFEAAMAESPELMAEMAELEQISAFAREAFGAPARDVDLSGVFGGVMSRIQTEEAQVVVAAADTASVIEGVRVQRAADGPGLFERIAKWFGDAFTLQNPMATGLVGAAAAALIAVVAMNGGTDDAIRAGGTPTIAAQDGGDKADPAARRGAETEMVAAGRNEAHADTHAVARGELKIIEFSEEDDQPLVLWHTVDGEGIEAPKSL